MTTIKDIAKAAQVSVSTASRALNNNPRISQATIERVKQIAEELGYQPNRLAKTLSTGEASVVGVIFPVTNETAPANPFQLDIIRGANMELVDKGFVLATAICQDQESLLKNVQAMVEQSKIHHFLVLYTAEDDSVLNYLRQSGQNVVLVGQPTNADDRYVNNNNVLAGQKATHHLCTEYAVKHPVLVRTAKNWAYEQDRERGYLTALDELGGQPLTFVLGEDSVADFWQAHPEVDGIISTDDITLLTLYNQMTGDMALADLPAICFNRSRLLSLVSPRVDRVDMLPRQLGSKAVDLLFDHQRHHQLVGFKVINSNQEA